MTISIVVVDDSDADRYILKRLVQSLGRDVRFVEFEDGMPFVDVVRDNKRVTTEIGSPPPPILVFLDINMPRMGGFEVLEQMKDAFVDEEQAMFVAIYSSSNHAEDRADTENYPFVKEYIVKPATAEKLEELLDKLYPQE